MYEHIRTYIQDVHKTEVISGRIRLTCITNVCQISEVDRATSPLITARNGWAENLTFAKYPMNFVSGLVDIDTSLYDLLPLAHGSLRSGYVVTCPVSAPF